MRRERAYSRPPSPAHTNHPAEEALAGTTIHFDHVGSLLRPKALFDARQRILGAHDADHNLGAHDSAELRAIEDQHIRDAVRLQEDCGLQLITDGDFRRRSWWTDFFMS